MSSNHIESAVDAALGPVQTVIVTAVRTAYASVATRHYNPDEGWDEQLFGFTVYKLIQHGITRTAQDTSSGISIDPNSLSFRFTVGGFRFGLYRLGTRAVDTIDASFPNNHNAAGELALDNVQYKFELGENAYMPHSLVIGHLGNHEFGCEQVWVAEPLHENEGAISGWGWTKQLWRFDGVQLQPTAVPVLPSAVPPKPVVLTLKRRSAKDNPPA
jgi:hypothetical protein